ncbi:hypothetical protein TRVL_01238 [Trypanosoma vivax]|nr:hypothetical protein TRVL_01238 [Trypanosoma vivax]
MASGDVEAGAFLRELARAAACSPSVTPLSSPALILTHAICSFIQGKMTAGSLLLVSILNRVFCLQDVPTALARPINADRPTDLSELLHFYVGCLNTSQALPDAVQTQLTLCVSSLLLLQIDKMNVIDTLLILFDGTVPVSGPSAHFFLKFFAGLMTVLGDRRVLLGPVRRSSQRLCVQKNVHLILNVQIEAGTFDVHAATVIQAISFLSDCTMQSPQEVDPHFWTQLPASSLWETAMQQLKSGAPTEVALEVVCSALRAITQIDTFSQLLLTSAFSTVLEREPASPLEAVCMCRVITSAMESCIATVVLELTPEHELYQKFAYGARVLLDVLGQGIQKPWVSGTEELALVVCEGIHVLTQVLTPTVVPPMEDTDCPEDYAIVVDDIHRENQRKCESLTMLLEFIHGCRTTLLVLLERFSTYDLKCVADYLNKNEIDEFAVRFDELPVSLFVAYERLCKLLFPITQCGTQHSEIERLFSKANIVLTAWNAELAYRTLTLDLDYSAPHALERMSDALLVPAVVRRFQCHWSNDERAHLVSTLTEQLRNFTTVSINLESAVAVSEGLRLLGAPAEPRLVEALWYGVQINCGEARTLRWSLAAHLRTLLPPGSLPCDILVDDCTLALLLSTTLSTMHDVWRVIDALQRMEPDSEYSSQSAENVASWVRLYVEQALSANAMAKPLTNDPSIHELEHYSCAVRRWCNANPLHYRVTWRLAKALNCADAADVLAEGLEVFILETVQKYQMEWCNEKEYFSVFVLETLASSQHASRLLEILLYIIHIPSTCFTNIDLTYRLRAVLRGGNALLQKSCVIDNGRLMKLFCLSVHEYQLLQQNLVSALVEAEVSDNEWLSQELLEELTRFSQVTLRATHFPKEVPEWLLTIRNAVDEYEIKNLLKSRLTVLSKPMV